MIKKLLAGAALAAVMIPAAVLAENEMVAAEGGFELWASTVGDEKGWAVVDTEDDAAVVAEQKDGEVAIYTGKKADDSLARMREAMPREKVIRLGEASDIRILTDRGDTETLIVELDGEGNEGLDAEVRAVLEANGIAVPGKGNGHRIVIREVTVDKDTDIDADIEIEGEPETRIRVLRMPKPPAPPEPPVLGEDVAAEEGSEMTWHEDRHGDHDVTVIEAGEGRTVVASRQHKMVYEYKMDDDGLNKRFMHMTGVSAEDAREFIEDIEELSASDKQEMLTALEL